MFLMLERIYGELQEVKGEVTGLKGEVTSLKREVNDLKGEFGDLKSEVKENCKRLTKLEAKVENEMIDKINVLFDGYTQSTEISKRIERKVDHLTDKVEKQELDIRVIKGGR